MHQLHQCYSDLLIQCCTQFQCSERGRGNSNAKAAPVSRGNRCFKACSSKGRINCRYKVNGRQLDCLYHHFNTSEQKDKKPGILCENNLDSQCPLQKSSSCYGQLCVKLRELFKMRKLPETWDIIDHFTMSLAFLLSETAPCFHCRTS